ncbi:unnamed protein product [Rotaria socialis]|uniref:Mitochondrial carrier protein n=1 Tax=Rotaria socialis TaxID=392032 RepID=A0A820Y776_9BILA|nr:unnamed protein product [Rotaria socialis]
MTDIDLLETVQRSLISGSLAGCTVDLLLYPIDTVKTRLQQKANFHRRFLFSSLYFGVGSAMIGSGPSSAIFFLSYNLIKQTANSSSSSQVSMIAAAFGETCACFVRVPTEVIKQRAQVNRNLRLSTIVRSCLRDEGLSGLYRGYFATLAREIPFSMIQYPLWEFFKEYQSIKQAYPVSPWQGALCGSIAGGIAASITTPLGRLIEHSHPDASSHFLQVIINILKTEGFSALYCGVVPRTTWISIGGFVYFGAFEFVTSSFFCNKSEYETDKFRPDLQLEYLSEELIKKCETSEIILELHLRIPTKIKFEFRKNKFQSNRRQLAATLSNQYHLPNRHVFMKRTMAHLHEKSNLLHERLTDKKKIDYVKEHQHELK